MRGPHVRFCERADARLSSERHPTRLANKTLSLYRLPARSADRPPWTLRTAILGKGSDLQ